MNCGGMECRGAVLWLRGPTASCAKGLDGTVQTDQLRWLAAPTTGAVLSCSSVVDSSAVFGFVGQKRLAPLSAFLILATIPSKISLHSLIHWFLPSMTIYWAETEGRRERMMGGGGWPSVEGRVCRMMSSACSVKKSMSR